MKEEKDTDELTETVTFRIARGEKKGLKELARNQHMTMGDVLRALVRERIYAQWVNKKTMR